MQNEKGEVIDFYKKIRDVRIGNFVLSESLKNHPMANVKVKLRRTYYTVLEHFVALCSDDKTFTDQRLKEYRVLLLRNSNEVVVLKRSRDGIIKSIVNNPLRPWRTKYRYWLLCDIALILFNEQAIRKARGMLSNYLRNRQSRLLKEINTLLFNNELIPLIFSFAEELITQYRANRNFTALAEKRYIVTANMSAGKSTLINALIGKCMTRTSQEACTANLCYLYNKPFEDDAIHLMASSLNLNASCEDLYNNEKTEISYIASFFRASIKPHKRICIIDTPGVNFVINREHGKLTRRALKEEVYDYLIYVFNANRLGTDEEMKHLKFVTDNIPKNKIIFVINKLDNFNKKEDSIESSIDGVRNDLLSLGYENPIICPLSAYFALLIKLKKNGEMLTDDENDDFILYSKKFSKPEYDLSRYYVQSVQKVDAENNLTELAIKCGLYGFEQILYEGKPQE